jgi:hypothetical protein
MTNFDFYDEELFSIAYKIERFGFTTMGVNTGKCSVPGCDCPPPQGPPWFYSIGMLEHGHPEVVIVGDALGHPCELLSFAFDWHHEGESLPFGRDDCMTAGGATFTTLAIPRRCWAESSLVACWHNYYRAAGWPPMNGLRAPFVQLVVADEVGRFPWDDGCDSAFIARQPIIEDDATIWPLENRAARRADQRYRRRRS